MKIKQITLIALGLLISSFGFSQGQVKLLINKRVVGQVNVGSDVHIAMAEGKKYGIIQNLALEITSATIDREGGRRKIEITDESGQRLFGVKELPLDWHPGIYDLNISKARKALEDNKVLKIYYSFIPFKKYLAPIRLLLLTIHVDQ